MWPFRKKTIPTQCVCRIFDPRNDAPVTQIRDIGDSCGEVPRAMYDRFNDDGNMFLVSMASKEKPGEMDGWFATKANALEFSSMYFSAEEDAQLSRLMRLAASPPADPDERERATDDFMVAWAFYNEKLKFKPHVSLAEIIYSFSMPMRTRWAQYPSLKPLENVLFWPVIEDAIIREGKINATKVKEAVAEASTIPA